MLVETVILNLLLVYSYACPQALDWEKRSAEDRAARSDIVVVGYVTKSYKHLADSNTNYAVEFKIIRTIKGEDQIATVPHDSSLERGVYNITNFGSIGMCFADINMEHVYMLFLQIVDDHLSAHYTDLFGAAEVWTMSMEDRVVLANLGESSNPNVPSTTLFPYLTVFDINSLSITILLCLSQQKKTSKEFIYQKDSPYP